jgi:tight adherence protein B
LIEAIGQVRDGIRSGLSIEESLRGLIRHGPGVLRPEFAIFARELQLDGFAPALVAMQERLADPAFDLFAGSLLLSHHLGGHQVSQVLERLAFAARAQLKVQEELRAYQARTVLSARIVAALPLAILIVIRQVDPAYLAVFDDWIGQMVLAGCVVSVAIGYVAMLWIGRLPSEPRVF